MNRQYTTSCVCTSTVLPIPILSQPTLVMAQTDPGPRAGAASAGAKIAGLTVKESKFFEAGLDEFQEVQSVTGSVVGTEEGLGPRFNMNSCSSCHAQPAVGGTSPLFNPQVTSNPVPASQITLVTQTVPILVSVGPRSTTGPVREVRFSEVDGHPDGGVHQLFTITGLPGAEGCNISQPAFAAAHAAGTLRFRIPTPVFGLGLIEAIEDDAILAIERLPKPFGIGGVANRNGNDG